MKNFFWQKLRHQRSRFWLIAALSLVAFWTISLSFDQGSINHTPWVRWDSNHYLSISSNGYQAVRCGAYVCGNTGWFPFYPALIFIAQTVTSLPAHLAGLFISCAAFILLVLQVYFLSKPSFGPSILFVVLCVLPGSIYLVSVFPLSLATVFVLAYISALKRDCWLLACSFGFLGVAAYPSSVLCFAAPLFFFFQKRSSHGGFDFLHCLAASGSPWVSYFSMQWLIESWSGFPGAYLLTQQRYGHSIGFGFETLRTSLRYFYKNPIFMQSLIVFFLLLAVFVYLVGSAAWKDPVVSSLYVYILLIFMVYQLYGDSISSYRQEALMAPGFLFFAARLRLPWLLLGVAALLPLSLEMTKLFLSGVLV